MPANAALCAVLGQAMRLHDRVDACAFARHHIGHDHILVAGQAEVAGMHFGQLAQAGGGERYVEGEAAGGDRLDGLVLAQHDQGAGAAAEDPLEAVT